MRIACLVPEFPCLSETFVLQPIAALVARGHEVRVFAGRRPEEDVEDDLVARYDLRSRTTYWDVPLARGARLARAPGVLLGALRRGPGPVLRALDARRHRDLALSLLLPFAAARLAGSGRDFDVVHAHFGSAGRLAAALGEIGALRGPLVTSFYGYDLTQDPLRKGADWYRGLFRAGSLFLVPSELWRGDLARLGCPAGRIAVQRLPVETRTRFRPPQERPAEPPLRVLSVARFVEKKGLADGIRAVAALRRRGLDVRYGIIGSGPLRAQLESLIRELGVEGGVELLAPRTRERIQEAMAASHVLLAPSRTASDGDQEGTPVVILEAMACGMPIVSTQHSGIPEVVEDGRSGLLVAEGDVDGLAQALETLAGAAARRAALGSAGRARAEERHDLGRLVDRLEGLYAELARSRSSSRRAANS